MSTNRETLKLILGALLLAASVFSMAALPGFLDGAASTVPVEGGELAR